MKVYEDNSKTELVAEIPENRILSLLDWEHAEFGKEVFRFQSQSGRMGAMGCLIYLLQPLPYLGQTLTKYAVTRWNFV